MGKTFSCDFENCDLEFKKKSDLNKHIVGHEDPSKLFRCPDCPFTTKYLRGLKIHKDTHSGERPRACPDMIRADATSKSGTSTQPFVSETPCRYRTSCPSLLIKHRVKYHDYVTDPKRSRRRAPAPAPSQVDLQMTAPRYDSFPVSSKSTISSDDRACYSAKYSSAPAYPSATSPPVPVVQPFDNKHYSAPVTHYGEAWNTSYAVSAKSIGAYSSVASQNNYGYRGVPTFTHPVLPNGPATVSRPDSFYYATNNAIATSSNVTRTSPQPPYNPAAFIWLKASRPEAESTSSATVAPYTANYGSSLRSYVASPESPPEVVEQPLDNNVYSEVETLYDDASNYNGYTDTLAVESIDANTSVAPQNNHADRGVPLLAPTPIPIQPVLQELLDDDYSTSSATGVSDLETEAHEDEIFFRGTGREGCLCPDMMVNAGIEGWDGSILDTQQEYYDTHSFA